jgi:SAM-dependent methyltransferase
METVTTHALDEKETQSEAWQLKMFSRSLKKQQKLKTLLGVLGPLESESCILLTCGDNNGALNWHFKRHGGSWTWADAEEDSQEQISELTGDPTVEFSKDNAVLPLPDNSFDVVLTIDVHEHLADPGLINKELVRIARPDGRVIVTTPGGDQKKLANRIKRLAGMRKEDYGHFVDGYDAAELEQQLLSVGLRPYQQTSYSHFFTEMIELTINLVFVKVLGKGEKVQKKAGQIAPQNREQIKSVEKTYQIYSLLYPMLSVLSSLDRFVMFRSGYAPVVAARKE